MERIDEALTAQMGRGEVVTNEAIADHMHDDHDLDFLLGGFVKTHA